jgi:hypothetical protein
MAKRAKCQDCGKKIEKDAPGHWCNMGIKPKKAKALRRLVKCQCPYCQANIGVEVSIDAAGKVRVVRTEHYE